MNNQKQKSGQLSQTYSDKLFNHIKQRKIDFWILKNILKVQFLFRFSGAQMFNTANTNTENKEGYQYT